MATEMSLLNNGAAREIEYEKQAPKRVKLRTSIVSQRREELGERHVHVSVTGPTARRVFTFKVDEPRNSDQALLVTKMALLVQDELLAETARREKLQKIGEGNG